MQVNVLWLSYREDKPAKGYWDQAMLMDLFSGKIWLPTKDISFTEHFSWESVPYGEGAIVCLPAYEHRDYVDKLNEDIASLPWCILVLGEDEVSEFPWKHVRHPNIKLWIMYPRVDMHDDPRVRAIPIGYTPHAREYIPLFEKEWEDKPYDWVFSGQVNHPARKDCVYEMSKYANGWVTKTQTFAAGLDCKEYIQKLSESKICPSPSGLSCVDSFRFYEAIEAGAIPIVDDNCSRRGYPKGFFSFLFKGDFPIPLVTRWDQVDSIMPGLLNEPDQWRFEAAKIGAWWIKRKRELLLDLERDIESLSCPLEDIPNTANKITVLICSSPIMDHPSLAILEETLASIRQYRELQDAEVIIMLDGVHPEQTHYNSRYYEYLRRVVRKCNFEWKQTIPVIFDRHTHQVGMTRHVLDNYVHTSHIMFVEHDTPLMGEIPWATVIDACEELDIVRFLHESHILKEHRYLAIDSEPTMVRGLHVVRTLQYSQRPHVAKTKYYARMLERNFSPAALSMIEDKMHSVAQVHPNRVRMGIYHPEGNIQRSYHTDGRKDDPKFDMVF